MRKHTFVQVTCWTVAAIAIFCSGMLTQRYLMLRDIDRFNRIEESILFGNALSFPFRLSHAREIRAGRSQRVLFAIEYEIPQIVRWAEGRSAFPKDYLLYEIKKYVNEYKLELPSDVTAALDRTPDAEPEDPFRPKSEAN